MGEENYKLRLSDFKPLFLGLDEYEQINFMEKMPEIEKLKLRGNNYIGLLTYHVGTVLLLAGAMAEGLEMLLIN